MGQYEEIVRLKVKEDFKAINKKLDKFEKKLKTTKKAGQSFGKVIGGAFAGILAAIGVVKVLGLIKDQITSSIKGAIDYGEAVNKLNVSFSEIPNDVAKKHKALREEYHLSNRAIVEYYSGIGDLLTGFGLTQKASLDLADNITRLSTDISSFANLPVDQAIHAITKAMTGEREMLKSLGVVVNEEMVKREELIELQKLTKDGFSGTTDELNRTARANATYNLILEQSKNAMGDFNRSLDVSVPNQWRLALNRISDVKGRLGQKVVPLLLEGLKKLNKFLTSQTFEDFVVKIEKALDGITFAEVEKGIKFAIEAIKNSFKVLKGIFGDAIYVAYKFITDFEGIVNSFKKAGEKMLASSLFVWESLYNQVGNYVDEIIGRFVIFDRAIKKILSGLFDKKIRAKGLDDLKKSLSLNDVIEDTRKNGKELRAELEKTLDAIDEKYKDRKPIKQKVIVVKTTVIVPPPPPPEPPKSLLTADELLELEALYNRIPEIAEANNLKELEARRKTVNDLIEINKKPVEARSENDKDLLKNHKELNKGVLANSELVLKGIDGMIAEVKEKQKKDFFKPLQDFVAEWKDDVINTVKGISEIVSNSYDARLMKLEAVTQAEREALERQTEDERELSEFRMEQEAVEFENTYGITEATYEAKSEAEKKAFQDKQTTQKKEALLQKDADKSRALRDKQIEKLEEEKRAKEKEINSDQFETEKKFNIVTATMKMAVAIVNALPDPVKMAFAGLIGGLQIGKIAGQPNPYAYREGGIAMTRQTATLAEDGRPEMVLPADTTEFIRNAVKNWSVTKTINAMTPSMSFANPGMVLADDTAEMIGKAISVSLEENGGSIVNNIGDIHIQSNNATEFLETLKHSFGVNLLQRR